MSLPFGRIKAFSVDDVKVTNVMEPQPFSASLSSDFCVENRKFCAENVVEKGAFSRTLSSEDCDVGVSGGKLL